MQPVPNNRWLMSAKKAPNPPNCEEQPPSSHNNLPVHFISFIPAPVATDSTTNTLSLARLILAIHHKHCHNEFLRIERGKWPGTTKPKVSGGQGQREARSTRNAITTEQFWGVPTEQYLVSSIVWSCGIINYGNIFFGRNVLDLRKAQ